MMVARVPSMLLTTVSTTTCCSKNSHNRDKCLNKMDCSDCTLCSSVNVHQSNIRMRRCSWVLIVNRWLFSFRLLYCITMSETNKTEIKSKLFVSRLHRSRIQLEGRREQMNETLHSDGRILVEIRRRASFAWSRHQNDTGHSPAKHNGLMWGRV